MGLRFLPRLRPSLSGAAIVVATTAAALAACSGGSSNEGADAGAEAASKDAGHRDASTRDARVDATHADAPFDVNADALSDAGACVLGSYGEPVDLRCTGLYSDWSIKTVSADVKEFVPGLQLWSDGAEKTRWIYLPPGQQIDTSDMDEWTFPVGTKLWKEFRLPIGSSTTTTRLETRLIWKTAADTWYRTTYRWSPDGETSATELTQGELDANGDGYEIPTQHMCSTCHEGRLDGVLGFEAVGLSAPGASLVTMATLESDGLLSAPPTAPLTIPGDAVESAALGWIHVNCGTACHNRGSGGAYKTGFFTRLDVSTLATVETTDTYTTGWNVPTVAYQIPDASTTYRFHACDLGESAAYYRSSLRDGVDGGGTQMPPIDTHRVDEGGIAEIAAWINEDCDAQTEAGATDSPTGTETPDSSIDAETTDAPTDAGTQGSSTDASATDSPTG